MSINTHPFSSHLLLLQANDTCAGCMTTPVNVSNYRFWFFQLTRTHATACRSRSGASASPHRVARHAQTAIVDPCGAPGAWPRQASMDLWIDFIRIPSFFSLSVNLINDAHAMQWFCNTPGATPDQWLANISRCPTCQAAFCAYDVAPLRVVA